MHWYTGGLGPPTPPKALPGRLDIVEGQDMKELARVDAPDATLFDAIPAAYRQIVIEKERKATLKAKVNARVGLRVLMRVDLCLCLCLVYYS